MAKKGSYLKEAATAVLSLTLIAVLAAGALSFTHEKTQEIIKKNNPVIEVLGRVMPAAADFVSVGNEDVYEAYDNAGNLVGYTFIAVGKGHGGDITVAGAIDLDYKVTRMEVIRQTETPGLGSKITEEGFQSQFAGVSVEELRLSPEGKIDAITSATISAEAVVEAMRKKIEEIRG